MCLTLALPYVFGLELFENLLLGAKACISLLDPVSRNSVKKESCFIWTNLYLCQVHFCCGFQTMCASCVYK